MAPRRDRGGEVGRTLEERASEELDELYRGALFLCAGHPSSAEALLVEAVTSAVPRRRGEGHGEEDGPDGALPLEQRLVRTFLRAPASVRAQDLPARRPGDAEGASLFAAAGTVPPAARAAIWLVMIRRRSYALAARRMEVDLCALRRLLRHRERFVRAALHLQPGGARRVGGER